VAIEQYEMWDPQDMGREQYERWDPQEMGREQCERWDPQDMAIEQYEMWDPQDMVKALDEFVCFKYDILKATLKLHLMHQVKRGTEY
jgi:hypothetical protein